MFKSELLRLVNINPQKELEYRRKLTKYADEVVGYNYTDGLCVNVDFIDRREGGTKQQRKSRKVAEKSQS